MHSFYSVQLFDVRILDSGNRGEETLFTTSLNAFTAFPEIHVPAYPNYIWDYNCSSLVSFTNCSAITVTNFSVVTQRCALAFFSSESTIQMHTAQFEGSDGTAALSINSALTVVLSEVVVSRYSNPQGVVFVEASEVTVANCSFQGNQADAGGAVYFSTVAHISISNSSFKSNSATYGGALFVEASGSPSKLDIRLCRFEGNTASSGVLEVHSGSAVTVSLSLVACFFGSNTGKQASILFWSQFTALGPDSTIRLSQFVSNTAARGGLLFFEGTSGTLTLSDSQFTGNSGADGVVLFFLCTAKCDINVEDVFFSANNGLSILSVAHSTLVRVSAVRFSENFGTGIVLKTASLNGTNCTFSTNSASSGAALHLISASASLSDSVFKSNSAGFTGGAVFLENYSQFTCHGCVLRNNTSSWHGGAVSAEQHSQVTIDSCTFTDNRAVDSGFALYLFMNENSSQVTDSTFEGNNGGWYGSIFLLSAVLSMRNCSLRNNQSQRLTAGLVLHLSTAEVSDSVFTNHTGLTGSLVYAYHTSAAITGCYFADAVATASGGAVAAITSSMTVLNSSFTQLTSPFGAAMVIQSGSVVDVRDSLFTDLTNSQSGVLAVTSSVLSLKSCVLQTYQDSGVFAADSNLTVALCAFRNASAAVGAGIHCSPCFSLEVAWSDFEDLEAGSGAALYLRGSHATEWTVHDSLFVSNVGSDSGAVLVSDSSTALTNNLFEANEACTGSGGALTLLSSQSDDFRLLNNTFLHNSAKFSGGGLFWTGSKPHLTLSDFEGNAALYGPNMASYAVKLALESALNISRIASGHRGEQRLSLVLLDHYGQVVTTDSSSFAQLTSLSASTTFAGVFRVQAEQGRFVFDDFSVVSPPGGKASITVNWIEAEGQNSTLLSVEFPVGMRPCQAGESAVSGTCFVCQAGTYSLDPAGGCKDCPVEAECYGNDTMVPKPGYWRSSQFSETFFRCPNPAACLGSPTGLNLTGMCAEGYDGNKCQSCGVDFYSRDGLYCSPCSSLTHQLVLEVVYTLVAGVVLTLIVASILSASLNSLRMKIFIDYVQMVMLLAPIHFTWPRYFLDLFAVQQGFGAFPELILSLHCFPMGQDEEDSYYRRLILVCVCQAVLLLFSILFWLATRRPLKSVRNEIICSAIVVFFLAYPSVIRVALGVFHCEEIATGEFWIPGAQVRCWTTMHSKFAFGLALPYLVLVGLMTPLLMCVIVQRQRLRGSAARLRYRFLLQSYSLERRYWEFVVLSRKVLIIVIAGFVSSFSPGVQAASTLGVLLVSLMLLHRYKPFAEPEMQMLDVRSHLTVISTLYSGLLYYTSLLSTEVQVTLFATIVFLNCYLAVQCFRSMALSLGRLFVRKMKALCKTPPSKKYKPAQVEVFEERSLGNRNREPNWLPQL